MATKNFDIQITVNAAQAKAEMNSLKGAANLVNSAFAAMFRTAIVAGAFLAIREVTQGIQNLTNAVKEATANFSKLQQKGMLTAATLANGGDKTAEAFANVQQIAREISTQGVFSSGEIQEGLLNAAQAGYKLEDSVLLASKAMKMGSVNMMDFQATLESLIGVSNSFRISMDALPQITDALTAASLESVASLESLFAGLNMVGGIASTAFDSLEDSSKKVTSTFLDSTAALMTLNDAGIKGSKAGIYLRGTIQQLMGSTSQITGLLARYGINIYDTDSKNQHYFETILKGQSVLDEYRQKLNTLKGQQFSLLLNPENKGKKQEQWSKELNSVNSQIASTQSMMSMLSDGIENSFNEFQAAGGKLRPLSEILKTLKTSIPTDVLVKAFGVRGGSGIAVLLNNFEKFSKHRSKLIEYVKESEKGNSLLESMYSKMVTTVFTKGAQLKNTFTEIFGAIFDAISPHIANILDPIINGLKSIFTWVEQNKNLFGKLFEGGTQGIGDKITGIFGAGLNTLKSLAKVFSSGKMEYDVPYRDTTGKLSTQKQEATGTPLEKASQIFQSLFTWFINEFQGMILKLAEQFSPIFQTMGQLFMDVLVSKTSVWVEIGSAIGKGMLESVNKLTPWGAAAESTKSGKPGLATAQAIGGVAGGAIGALGFFGGPLLGVLTTIAGALGGTALGEMGYNNELKKSLSTDKNDLSNFTPSSPLMSALTTLDLTLAKKSGLNNNVTASTIQNTANVINNNSRQTKNNVSTLARKITVNR